MEEKRDLRVVRTQRCLREAFFELVAEKPIDKITIRELTERAQVSRCTFYLHYDSIYDIAKSIEDEMLFDFREGFRNAIRENRDSGMLIDELIIFSFRHKLDNLPYSRELYKGRVGSELLAQYNLIAAQELKKAFPGKWNDRLAMALDFYVCGIINLIHQWILEEQITETPEEMSKLIIEMIKNGGKYLSFLNK